MKKKVLGLLLLVLVALFVMQLVGYGSKDALATVKDGGSVYCCHWVLELMTCWDPWGHPYTCYEYNLECEYMPAGACREMGMI
jgi:hypothetical protein